MPIYAYRCSTCGHTQDVLQKISDAPLNLCSACGQSTFTKQVTAAGFQLKGSGWYATDFRGNSKTTSESHDQENKPATEKPVPADNSSTSNSAAASPTTSPTTPTSSTP